MQLKKEQLEERIKRLENWLNTHPENHYMWSAIHKELKDYRSEMEKGLDTTATEFEINVHTQFCGQLEII